MATLTRQSAARSANDLAFVTASDGGDDFVTTGTEMLLVRNNAGTAVSLTVPLTVTIDGESVADKSIAVAAGALALLGPWPRNFYADTEQKVSFNFGVDYASVELALIGA